MHSMVGLRQARHMHRDRWHVHGSIQKGVVFFGLHLLFYMRLFM